jgi:uncharacterized delta-60 repeat protein
MTVQSDEKIVLAGIRQTSAGADAVVVRLNPDGSSDSSFGAGGVVALKDAFGFAVALQADGKILLGAHAFDDLVVARFLPDGRLDTSFGRGGAVFTDFGGTEATFALAVQPDGKIVAAGRATALHSLEAGDFAVVRYNPDGSLDSSFGGGGKVRTDFGGGEDALDIAMQSDGRIVVVGASGIFGSPWAVARYNADGSLDSSFDADGKVVTDFGGGAQGAWGVALQPDGKIVVAGWRGEQGGGVNRAIALARYLPEGRLDPGFSGDGRVAETLSRTDTGREIVLQPNGKIVVAGAAGEGPDLMIARFLPDGRIDPSFGGRLGFVQTDFGGDDAAFTVALDRQQRIVAAGGSRQEATGGDVTLARVLVGACLVPRLARMTLAEARTMLEQAGCRLGDVRRVRSKTVKRGRIVAQIERAGARLDDFAAVNVVVSRGKR